jgi:hypothetical protein
MRISFRAFEHRYPGTYGTSMLSANELREAKSLRTFITRKKYEDATRGIPKGNPKIVRVLGEIFIIDGHHRSRFAVDRGEGITVEHFETDSKALKFILDKKAKAKIGGVEIR